jgi:hypothetical protein
MRASSAGISLALALALAADGSPSGVPRRAGSSLPADLLALDSVRLAVMEPNGVFPGDLDLLPPGGRRDRFRLSRVESVLGNPFRLEGVVEEVLARTEPFPRTQASADSVAARPLPVPPDFLWPLLDAEPEVRPGWLPGMPGSPDSALGRIRAGLDGQMAALSSAERDFLFREASSLFLEEEEDTSLAPVAMEPVRAREERIARSRGLRFPSRPARAGEDSGARNREVRKGSRRRRGSGLRNDSSRARKRVGEDECV